MKHPKKDWKPKPPAKAGESPRPPRGERPRRAPQGATNAPRPEGQAAPPKQGNRVLKTLDRMLSKAGLCSRTEAREWITRGRLKVNGQPVHDPEHWVDPDRDRIVLDGKPLRAERKIYILLYKPKGFLTTYKDPDGRPTVYDLLGDLEQWVFPVGRLDQDTSGLLILTNDTAFAEHVTNPEFHVPKTYLVKASTVLDAEALGRLRDGLELKDGPTRPAQVKHIRDSASRTFFEITITEGRNRQVRRMVEALDSKVLKLVRIAIGPIRIHDLAIGHWRELAADEVKSLYRAGGAKPPESSATPEKRAGKPPRWNAARRKRG